MLLCARQILWSGVQKKRSQCECIYMHDVWYICYNQSANVPSRIKYDKLFPPAFLPTNNRFSGPVCKRKGVNGGGTKRSRGVWRSSNSAAFGWGSNSFSNIKTEHHSLFFFVWVSSDSEARIHYPWRSPLDIGLNCVWKVLNNRVVVCFVPTLPRLMNLVV
jgi:hypothetical protein